jgi:hypothetical protein
MIIYAKNSISPGFFRVFQKVQYGSKNRLRRFFFVATFMFLGDFFIKFGPKSSFFGLFSAFFGEKMVKNTG